MIPRKDDGTRRSSTPASGTPEFSDVGFMRSVLAELVAHVPRRTRHRLDKIVGCPSSLID